MSVISPSIQHLKTPEPRAASSQSPSLQVQNQTVATQASVTSAPKKDILTLSEQPPQKPVEIVRPDVLKRHGVELNPLDFWKAVETASDSAYKNLFSHGPKGVEPFLERYQQMPAAPKHVAKLIGGLDHILASLPSAIREGMQEFNQIPAEKTGQHIRSVAQLNLQSLATINNMEDLKLLYHAWLARLKKQPAGIATDAEWGQAIKKMPKLLETVWKLIPQIQKQSFKDMQQSLQKPESALQHELHEYFADVQKNTTAWVLQDKQQKRIGTMSVAPLSSLMKSINQTMKRPIKIPADYGYGGITMHADQLQKQDLSKAMADNLINQARTTGFKQLWLAVPKQNDLLSHLKYTYSAETATLQNLEQKLPEISKDVLQSLLSSYNIFNHMIVHIKL